MAEWEKVEMSPTWDFEEKPEMVGIFKGVEKEVGANASNLYTFKLEDGELISVWGSTILDTRLKNLEIGEEVKISYLGKEKSPTSGREYKNFDVFHRMPEASDDGK